MTSQPQFTPAQRRAAVDRTGENLALRSGAGCGKTLVLAGRFTQLLMSCPDEENPLSRFVALTFTDKAALEMADRVRRFLSDRAAEARSDADRARLRRWIDELPEARISTIHSFCAALLRAHAIDAGIDPGFAVCADELLVGRLIAEAADQAVLSVIEERRAAVAELLEGASYGQVVRHVAGLVEDRTLAEPQRWTDADAVLAHWRTVLSTARDEALTRLRSEPRRLEELDEIAAIPCTDADDKLQRYRCEQVDALRAILGGPDEPAAAEFARLSDKPGNVGSKKAWPDATPKEVRDRIKALVAPVAEEAFYFEPLADADAQAARAVAALATLAVEANSRYAAEKRRRGILDFTDLLAESAELLRRRPRVAAELRGSISQLLIDECQDTDPFQLTMLLELIFGREGPVPSGVEGLTEAAGEGKLFLVGDPMQSIYRFRGARVEQFRSLCRAIGRDRREDLDVSFRTHAAGVAFVNRLFGEWMQDYQPIRAFRTHAPPEASVELLLAEGPEGPVASAEDATAAQAAATAERICEMVGREERVWDAGAAAWRPVRYGNVAILFGRMTESLEYERQLALRGVPHYVVSGSGFFRQQEVYDLLNALRAIDNPRDDIAALGVLRSSLFALDDNVLMRIAGQMPKPYLPALAGRLTDAAGSPRVELEGLPEADAAALGRAVKLLMRLHRGKDALGADRLLAELLAETAYEAALLADPYGRRIVGNVRRLRELARTAQADHVSLAEFVAHMDESTLEESRYEQAAVVGEAEDVVRLMTIHKAKGLEFPVVVLPDLNAGRQGPRSRLLWGSDWGVTYAPPAPAGEDEPPEPVSHRIAKERERRDDEAERVRKLYVAVTRHRDHLVLVGADWRNKAGDALQASGSYLARLDAEFGLADALAAGGTATIPYQDGGVTYELQARPVRPAPGRAAPARGGAGRRLIRTASGAADLGERLAAGETADWAAGDADAVAAGPLGEEIGRPELAVTALSDFDHCPMLYRWRYELRLPTGLPAARSPSAGEGPPPGATGLDPLTLGSVLHKAMELVDFADPGPGEPLQAAVREVGVEETADMTALQALWREVVASLAGHELAARLAGARQSWRELDFIMACGPAALRGQIDLLCRDAAGELLLVDYKSDRVSADEAGQRARRYDLQLQLYAAAAARHFGRPPAEAVLYFLRPATACRVAASAEAIAAAGDRAAALAAELIRARRRGRFERRESADCAFCPYGPYCR